MVDVKDPIKNDTRRNFEFKGKKFYINTPSSSVIKDSEWQHAKVYNEAINQGIFTTSEMEVILRKRGLIGEDYEQERVTATENLRELLVKLELARLNSGTSEDVLEKLAYDTAEARENLFKLNTRYTAPMNSTCEKLAEDAKVDFIISNVVVDEEGNKVWPTYNDYMNEVNTDFILTAKYEVLLWMQGVDSDIFNNIPENVILRDINSKKKERIDVILSELRNKALTASEEVSENVEDVEVKPKRKTKKAKEAEAAATA